MLKSPLFWLVFIAVTLAFLHTVWVVWGPDAVVALVKRAKRTPYYHLDGYMNRWWLVPYRREIERTVPLPYGDRSAARFHSILTDGTGPVPFRSRPLAWLIQRCGIAVRVHEILRSDVGRDPHDHPWSYLTIILSGYYWEHRYNDKGEHLSVRMHGPGSILWRPANSWHMLELAQGRVTTLFFTGSRSQTWGFNVEGKKVPYREYLGAKQ